MAKRPTPPEEIPPSLSKQQGQRALLVMKEKGEALLAHRPIQEAGYDTWADSTLDYIKRTFGSRSAHIHNFIGQIAVVMSGWGEGPDERQQEVERAKDLQRRIQVLDSLIQQIDTEIALEAPAPRVQTQPEHEFWTLLHAKVVTAARLRFDGGHYADAVEAAFKDLNTVVKEMVKKKTGQELDGASLMQKAFSPNPPVLVALDDLSTQSGQSIQEGYMQIFAGAMKGIRNPKAHANLVITRERCIHLLFLASLLFHKLDERP